MNKILVMVLAVLAAASMAKAEQITVDFDGKAGMNGVESEMFFGRQSALVVPMPENTNMIKSVDGISFPEFARYYLAQAKIKEAVAAYYRANNNEAAAAALASRYVRVAAADGAVYVLQHGKAERIDSPELAEAVAKLVHQNGQKRSAATVANAIAAGAASSAVAANVITGSVAIITCMTYDPCWNAVGDGVSAISEWLNS